ncbi:MAG: polymerase III, delta subunit protein [Candidatus Azambacteria bacterium GW2011_GWA1_42_19]|nr:MAG: polymerase III, delta subunit protein [Candidatus Azambacteria bacterium GW2011_GWA1_42_19]
MILEFLKTKDFNKREDTILIAVSFSDTGGGKLFEYLTGKPNQVQNFKLLKEYEIKNWVKKSLNAMGVEIAGDAMDFLVSNCGLDLWRLSNEIKKLADFSAQGGSPEGRKIKVIVKSQVEELIMGSREHNIFELTDALAKKNKIKALSALHKALDGGEKPTELLGLLAWQVRNILRFKLSSKLSELKLHPFVLGKIKESAEYFSAAELNVILSKIIDLDLAFKTTDLNEKTALSLLISEL